LQGLGPYSMCDKKRRPALKTAPPQPKGKSRSTPATMSRSVCGNEESLLRLIYRLTDHANQLRPSAITIAADSARKNDKICCQSELPQGGGASPSSGVSVTVIVNTPTKNSRIPSRTKTRGQPYIGRILHRLGPYGVLGRASPRNGLIGIWLFGRSQVPRQDSNRVPPASPAPGESEVISSRTPHAS
jgi:hypothetical protein